MLFFIGYNVNSFQIKNLRKQFFIIFALHVCFSLFFIGYNVNSSQSIEFVLKVRFIMSLEHIFHKIILNIYFDHIHIMCLYRLSSFC